MYWLRPHDANAFVDLSSNDAASIQAAADYWVTTSAVAVAFICLICAFAWWHQRRLRKMFKDEADRLDEGDARPPRSRFEAMRVIRGRDVDVPPQAEDERKVPTDGDIK